ncbi:phosphatase PAP2 family protein [Geomonas limicola]|uniref:Phosphatase PAP2 family protein n=1 Tax=Geomonas limicola TaxID=2740186 RepID=A0A6V8NIH4_9BACT|nr:phosphatase PAP2 family protein [Geomonas limicola]GFO70719.1 phosphatase PAP2 family protein [Geomonas limicola]
MRRNTIMREFLLVLVVLVGATALCAATGLDLGLEQRFYLAAPNWGIGNLDPWRFLYRFGIWPSYLLSSGALVLLVAGFFSAKALLFRKSALFMVLLMLLGPGLLVNAVFKDHWGRPRPRQMQLFGGDRPFHQPWERGIDGAGRSFPSGHASAGFYLIAPYFVLRARDRRRALLALAAGLCYGAIMGVARMAQGGHFPTDVLWAGGIVYLVGLALYYLLRLDEPGAPVLPVPGETA